MIMIIKAEVRAKFNADDSDDDAAVVGDDSNVIIKIPTCTHMAANASYTIQCMYSEV